LLNQQEYEKKLIVDPHFIPSPIACFYQGINGFDRIFRIQVFRKELVDLDPNFFCQHQVHPIEAVSSGSILENLVFEFFTFCFEGLDKMLHFKDIHILVIGVGVDEQRGVLEFVNIVGRGAAAVFLYILAGGLANMIISRIQVPVAI